MLSRKAFTARQPFESFSVGVVEELLPALSPFCLLYAICFCSQRFSLALSRTLFSLQLGVFCVKVLLRARSYFARFLRNAFEILVPRRPSSWLAFFIDSRTLKRIKLPAPEYLPVQTFACSAQNSIRSAGVS